MRTAAEWVTDSTTGNTTTVDVEADIAAVWDALHGVSIVDTPISGLLLRIRLLPARLRRRGSGGKHPQRAQDAGLIQAMASTRFLELYREEPTVLTLGVVGQFWKLSGGTDAAVRSPEAFAHFNESGFVKAAIDFELEPIGEITRLTTTTCNRATDADTERVFGRYWHVIGLGSKFIRWELLRAVRSKAESAP